MRICIVVNDVDTEITSAATTVIAHAAAHMGHTVYMTGVGDLTYRTDGSLVALCRRAPEDGGGDQPGFLRAVQGEDAERVRVSSDDIDVLYLRYNPAETPEMRWEYDAGLTFGQMAVLRGVVVLSHPYTLAYAVNKMYLQHFPESIRPRTVITRRLEEVERFREAEGGKVVLKPLLGYGGQDVHLIEPGSSDLRDVVERITRTGYVVVQEYLASATAGDTRLFLFNGRPLVCEGKVAAVRRVNETGDFRSNMSVGGRPRKAEITPGILEIAEIVRPRLLADGLFDVGLDIVGDKLVEINTISSGGLNAAGRMEGVNFGEEVVRLIERKVVYRARYGSQLRNRALAVMD